MGALEIYLFFLLCFPSLIRCKEYCPYQCSKGEPIIQFPFRVSDRRQDELCGYPGFDLTCNSWNKTVLELPFSGEFFVRNINSFLREIEIYDTNNCLPGRLLNLNLSGSPFHLNGPYQKYMFFNCSSSSVDLTNISSTSVAPISCLSTSTHTILATNLNTTIDPYITELMMMMNTSTSCELVATVSIPIQRKRYLDGVFYEVSEDLVLTWPWVQLPPYGASRYSTDPPKQACRIVLKRFDGGGVDDNDNHMSLAQSSVIVPHQQSNLTVGLDDSTIQSYPRILVDDNGRLPNPNNTTCPICISEYRPKETLKSIPACNHFFHANCIDRWLRVNATCPVCRKSPIPSVPPPPHAT
ncbi:zinc finger protein [Macleaya cordata]|uniref:RING-type E3 ubiquitin transferase n=1 Tax=Macleaya cordata TaxID=56857 RepID=A0A200PUS1_MACCD|nr:zinc finger protein [Macleaya cordata]